MKGSRAHVGLSHPGQKGSGLTPPKGGEPREPSGFNEPDEGRKHT
jgi:hypothetical protein